MKPLFVLEGKIELYFWAVVCCALGWIALIYRRYVFLSFCFFAISLWLLYLRFKGVREYQRGKDGPG